MRRPDLIQATSIALASLLLATAAPAQDPFPDALHAFSGTAASLATGDMNGDGRPDVALTVAGSSAADGRVVVALQKPGGGLGTVTTVLAPITPSQLTVGDANNDGKLDLLTVDAQPAGSVVVLLNDGAGGFATSVVTPLALAGPTSIAAADVNVDGKLDAVTTHLQLAGANVTLALGDGAGGFPTAIPFSGGTFPMRAAIGDLNGDALPDLAVTNVYTGVTYSGPGSGAVPYDPGNTVSVLLAFAPGAFAAPFTVPTSNGPGEISIADVNG